MPERSIVIVRTNLYGRILSATGGGRKATPTNPLKRISLINKFKKFNIKSVLLRLKYLRRVSESVF